jgi:heptosyltransferase-2
MKVAQSLALPELAAHLQQCTIYLGHDSGISHLAAALGLHGIVLWGPTRQHVWGPRSDRFVTLTGSAGIESIPASKVIQELNQLLENPSQPPTS